MILLRTAASSFLFLATAAIAVAQEVTPSTPSIDSRYGSTTAPPDSPADSRDAALKSRGDPNPTSMGTGHALSEALTQGAPNATPTPGAAPRPTPLQHRQHRHRLPTNPAAPS